MAEKSFAEEPLFDLVNKDLTLSKWITQTLLEVSPGI